MITAIFLLNDEDSLNTIFNFNILKAWDEYGMATKYTHVFRDKWIIINILHMGFHSDRKYEKHELSHSFAVFERLPNVQCYLLI